MYYEYNNSLDSRVDRQSAFFTWIAHADENNHVMCRLCYFRERKILTSPSPSTQQDFIVSGPRRGTTTQK